MKTLLENYKIRLKTITSEIEKGYDEPTNIRLRTKASCFRTFISELEKLQPFEPQENECHCGGYPDCICDITRAAKLKKGKEQSRQTAEEILDLQQYVTNLLYDALEQGFKLRHYAGIGEGFRNADTGEFDKWVEEQTELLKEYAQNQQPKEISVTDEEIEGWERDEAFSSNGKDLIQIQEAIVICYHTGLRVGAKAMRDGKVKQK